MDPPSADPVKQEEKMSESARPKFDPTFNLGHLFTILSILLTAFGGIWYTATETTNIDHRISNIERGVAGNTPRVDALTQGATVINERMTNLLETQRELRRQNSDLMSALIRIREDVAGIAAQLNSNRRPPPAQPPMPSPYPDTPTR